MSLDVLTVAVLALVGTRLAVAARTSIGPDARRRTRLIITGLRPRHFLLGLPVLVAVVAAAALLVQVPGLSLGWWTAIGGTGNIVTGGTSRTAGTSLEWLIPTVFLFLLVPALPLLAEREEEVFRVGAEDWSVARRAGKGLQFGLAHLVMGIPLGVGLALSLGGWYFTWAYLRGHRRGGGREAGLLESTRSHLAYNAVVLGIVALVVAGVVQ